MSAAEFSNLSNNSVQFNFTLKSEREKKKKIKTYGKNSIKERRRKVSRLDYECIRPSVFKAVNESRIVVYCIIIEEDGEESLFRIFARKNTTVVKHLLLGARFPVRIVSDRGYREFTAKDYNEAIEILDNHFYDYPE